MNTPSDTIAAIATTPGPSGIAIIRISGPQSLDIADKLFDGTPPAPSKRLGNTFIYGHIHSPAPQKGLENNDLDEVILLIYRAPHSYTREDTVEIQTHGGSVCARKILAAVLSAGARPAEPGEFTKRAFLNGRIDLLQAEAVADIIRARSDRAAAAALEQLKGGLSSVFSSTYDNLLNITANLEAALDFPDDELPQPVIPDVLARLKSVIATLTSQLSTWNEGHLLREGALVVISGKPNSGKSTLMNHLLGTDRAIVTDTPGTTRDFIEEQIVLDGIPLRLIDTAGLRSAKSTIEQAGVRIAQEQISKADLHLHVIDASQAAKRNPGLPADLTNSNTIIVLNKIDLGQKLHTSHFPEYTAVSVSLLTDRNIPSILSALSTHLHTNETAAPHAVISERHRSTVHNVLNELNAGTELLSSLEEQTIALSAVHLKNALEQLGAITGRTYDENLLSAIFSKFCVGK
ncbi:tRNA uridine-5-carboxymethylaminomethyl(34) synthesis GTPase MnmE [Verrucomicrobiota bacterium]